MSKPITLIIADDEPFICGMLEKLINFDALGLTLLVVDDPYIPYCPP